MVPFKYQISDFLQNAGIQFGEVNDSIGFKLFGPSNQVLTFIAGGDEDTGEISLMTFVNPGSSGVGSSIYRIVNELNANSNAVRLSVIGEPLNIHIAMQIQYFINLGVFDDIFDRMIHMLLDQAEELMSKF